MYYTNWELGKVDWFLTSEYITFYNMIDENGGIYTKRWGDAPIKFLGVNLFMPQKHFNQFMVSPTNTEQYTQSNG